MAFDMKNVTSRMQTALAAADAITGISKASEAVITVNNTYSAGDYVVITVVSGMIEINNQVVRVKSPSGTEFTAEGLDSTGYTTYTSGGSAAKVSSWATLDNVSSLDFQDIVANKLDVTPISAREIAEINGFGSAPGASFAIFADPLNSGVVALRAASADKTTPNRVFEFIFNDEGFTIFCIGEVSGGNGLSGSAGQVVQGGNVQLTLKKVQQYVAT